MRQGSLREEQEELEVCGVDNHKFYFDKHKF